MQDEFEKKEKTMYFPTLPYLTPERSQKFLGIILTLVTTAFFGFFAISPTVSTILKLQKEITDNQFVYDELDTKIKNLNALRKQYIDLQNDLFIITNAIAIQPDAPLLFAQIQSIAQTSNIKLSKLQNFEVEIIKNDKAIGKNYYSFTFAIAGTGSSENIYNFVSRIASMQRIINIDGFTISNTTEQQNQSLGFNIQGRAFFKE